MADMGTEFTTEDRKEENHAVPGRQLRGLYAKVNISVRALNIIIIVLALAIVVCMYAGISNAGFQVNFDSQGGTVVESQKRMYGELIEAPEPPTREGYVFDGWYLDRDALRLWNLDQDIVTESVTLYAGWRQP